MAIEGTVLQRDCSAISGWIYCEEASNQFGSWEIRVRDVTGAYRVVYTARLVDAVYVLHVFQKKSRATSRIDVEIAARRFKVLVRTRG